MEIQSFSLTQGIEIILFAVVFGGAGLATGGLLALMVERARNEAERNSHDVSH